MILHHSNEVLHFPFYSMELLLLQVHERYKHTHAEYAEIVSVSLIQIYYFSQQQSVDALQILLLLPQKVTIPTDTSHYLYLF